MARDAVLNGLLWARMQLVRQTAWRSFARATRHPRLTQYRLLQELMRRNSATRFGREHGFDRVRSHEAYAQAVPVQTYETLRPYVEEQERTNRPALNADAPVMYARTSGTTGQAKLIPIPKRSLARHRRSQRLQACAQFAFDPRAYHGRLLGIVSPAIEGTLDSGRPYGSVSGHMYRDMPVAARAKYVVPYEVFGLDDYDLKYLLILRLAITQPDVSCIACANPSSLNRLLEVLDRHRAALLDDVTRGEFHRASELPDDVRAAIAPRLACAPGRADALRHVLEAPRPTFATLWPGLRLVNTWTGGSCRIALSALRPALPPGATIAELGYVASELRATIVVDLARGLGAPTLQENFFEFVERDAWDAGRHDVRLVDQLEPGRLYYVIVTTSSGLYRYFMNDIVTVTGRFHDTPTIQFVQKGKGVTNVTGEKLYESQVLEAVARAEQQLGIVATFYLVLADPDRAIYRLVVEGPDWSTVSPERVAAAVECDLAALNLEYAAKRASGRLAHLEVLPVDPGTGEAYKRHCLAGGRREGQFKLVALQYQDECGFPFDDFRAAVPTRATS